MDYQNKVNGEPLRVSARNTLSAASIRPKLKISRSVSFYTTALTSGR